MQVSCKVIKSFFRNLSLNITLDGNFKLIFYKFRMTKYDTKLCRVKGRRFMTSSSFINEKLFNIFCDISGIQIHYILIVFTTGIEVFRPIHSNNFGIPVTDYSSAAFPH